MSDSITLRDGRELNQRSEFVLRLKFISVERKGGFRICKNVISD